MLLTYFLNDFEMVPVAPIITGITFVFTFHMRCISIVRSLYFRIFPASSSSSSYYYCCCCCCCCCSRILLLIIITIIIVVFVVIFLLKNDVHVLDFEPTTSVRFLFWN
jgi:hypothetical protein